MKKGKREKGGGGKKYISNKVNISVLSLARKKGKGRERDVLILSQ